MNRRNTGGCIIHHGTHRLWRIPTAQGQGCRTPAVTTPGHVNVDRDDVTSTREQAALLGGSSLGTSTPGYVKSHFLPSAA